ncbi:MAG: thioredoxin fold domain-containing protein [Thiothrix sp.]|nr:thioredoxin fold domain-containing protein [Thiothrix sp.]HPQ94172.1 thioredoxin fold domain-containing protein [Thiolinea sp.]
MKMKVWRDWNRLFLLLCLLLPGGWAWSAAEAAETRGKVTGGEAYAIPDWFKQSFLDIAEDAEEAGAEGRHVMLFFHLDECPYCSRMLRESFEPEDMKALIQQHFDVIDINIKGDRQVAFDAETSLSEKELSDKLRVRSTPAILFLDGDNQLVVRLDGYRSARRFRHVLDYVSSGAYKDGSLVDFMAGNQQAGLYQLQPDPLFRATRDLSDEKGPLLVLFEDDRCEDCAEFHEKLLAREDIRAELAPYTVVRLDTGSDEPLVDVDGNRTTAGAWAGALKMTYRPGVVIFDQGKEISRSESLLFPFHFKEMVRYVGGGFNRTMTRGEFSDQYREALLSSGVDIDLGE